MKKEKNGPNHCHHHHHHHPIVHQNPHMVIGEEKNQLRVQAFTMMMIWMMMIIIRTIIMTITATTTTTMQMMKDWIPLSSCPPQLSKTYTPIVPP